jgi:hypothetical protein
VSQQSVHGGCPRAGGPADRATDPDGATNVPAVKLFLDHQNSFRSKMNGMPCFKVRKLPARNQVTIAAVAFIHDPKPRQCSTFASVDASNGKYPVLMAWLRPPSKWAYERN